jgi:hypothetical protein
MRETLVKSVQDNANDSAIVLQLVLVILYHDFTGFMLNIPGKCVPDVLDSLKSNLNEETFKKLVLLQSKKLNDSFL